MLSLDCSHPDVEEFIAIKRDLDKITKANISVRISDDFMKAAINNENFTLSYKREATGETIEKVVKARGILHKIAEIGWECGEPGVLFWDRITKYNMLTNTKEFQLAGTNPCGEMPLPAGGSCLLGSLNLAEFVDKGLFQFEEFEDAVAKSIRALNEVLMEGLPLHPLEEQRKSVGDWKQVGLGVMGIADMLIKMGIKYGSEKAIDVCNSVGRTLARTAIKTSIEIAADDESKICSKIDVDDILKTNFYQNNSDEELDSMCMNFHIANSQLLTIAPTGTLSTMLGISGGIEPIYANFYERKTESLHGEDVFYKVYTPIVAQYMKQHGLKDESELPDYFVTAQTIPYIERIKMQSVWQEHIDASISSTVNLPHETTAEDIENLYIEAWKRGLKGITIFRDGCARAGILTTAKPNESASEPQPLPRGFIMPKSDDLVGKLRTLTTGCGSLHVTAFFDPFTGDFVHAFLSKGSRGGCQNFMVGLSRTISLAARGGVSLEDIVDQLNSCGSCSSYAVRSATQHDTSKGSCCPMAIGNALIDMHDEMMREINDDESEEKPEPKTIAPKPVQTKKANNPCPSCGEELIFEGGCNSCKNCGYSKCS